ncbi:hypothetical protein [Acholeplasma laidlawii]|uniref:hypothetical protein n=1 Tax=Acholeplasma laidlawii TaxID=2148 RepID=UPI0021F7715F|nr:hypothetical protein [Acholeplasma laidlawii]
MIDVNTFASLLKEIQKTYLNIKSANKMNNNDLKLFHSITSHLVREYSNKIKPLYISAEAQKLINSIDYKKRGSFTVEPQSHGQLNDRNRRLREKGYSRPDGALNLDHLIEVKEITTKILNHNSETIKDILLNDIKIALITQKEHKSVKKKNGNWIVTYNSAGIKYSKIKW